MKQALNILIGYLTCTDPVIQNKWLNLLTSFWHKDAGWLLKSITPEAGGYKITVVDSDGNNVNHTISIPTLPNSQPISYIQGLQTALGNKVDVAVGKGLSTNDFTATLKDKLDNLTNYLHPEFHQISEIENLQDVLDTLAVLGDLAPVASSNDYNDLDNTPVFKVVQNEYADMAALYADQANQSSNFIQYVADAIVHPDVEEGSAYFEFFGTTNGDETDYRLLSNAESAPISVTNKLSISEIIVKDKAQIINQVLDSTKIYKIDSQITLEAGESIIVPSTGLTIDGHGFNISTIFSSAGSHTVFTSPEGGSGDLVLSKIALTTEGVNSKIFDINDVDGSHAIEVEYVNFSGCTSLGKQDGYRQGTWTTVGVYGCDDGLQLSGTWNGYKVSNSNCFGFDAGGTLFKKDNDTMFNNRLFLNVNIDLPTGAILADFEAANFSANELFQINSSIAKLNGTINIDNAAVLVPNITANNLKSLWVGNIGLPDTADEKYVEDLDVAATYKIDWLKDTYYLEMDADTTFSEINLPATGKNTQEIKIYLTGNFIPTFPAAWLVNAVGTYKGTDVNEITLKYIKPGLYFMKISNSLTPYPAPILGSITPISLLPNSTSELRIKGAFYTPEGFVLLDGQVVNSIEFEPDTGDYVLSVTSGALEGEFDITISNGTSVTFSKKLTINLGIVITPLSGDWSNSTGPIILIDSSAKTQTLGAVGTATWVLPFDFTKDFAIRVKPTGTPLGGEDYGGYKNIFELKRISDDVTVFAFTKRESGNVPNIKANLEGYAPEHGNGRGILSGVASSTPSESWSSISTYAEVRWLGGVLYMYNGNGTLLYTYTTVLTENLYLKVSVGYVDLVDIKYIELP